MNRGRVQNAMRDHKPEIGLGDDIGVRQSVPPIVACDFGCEPEVTCHKRIGGASIAPLLPASRKLLLLASLKQLEALDGRGVAVEVSPWRTVCGTLQRAGHGSRTAVSHL